MKYRKDAFNFSTSHYCDAVGYSCQQFNIIHLKILISHSMCVLGLLQRGSRSQWYKIYNQDITTIPLTEN